MCLSLQHLQPFATGALNQGLELGGALRQPAELRLGDLVVLGVAGLDVGLFQ